MSLYIDVTEFLACPKKTGIQRVVAEICRSLPPYGATPIHFTSGHYVALSPERFAAFKETFDTQSSRPEKLRRLATSKWKSALQLLEHDIVVVPEVFFDPERLAFFRTMSRQDFGRHRFLIYDLLPLTHSEYFVADMPIENIYAYFRTIRHAANPGFISEETREVYYKRLKREKHRGGVVLPLGADALGPRSSEKPLKSPPAFSVICTIEPRKNHELILDAFEPLLRQIDGLALCFMGSMGWVSPALSQRIHQLAADPHSGFTFCSTPDDAAIRRCIEGSRATVYVSCVEGYGLPPVESLWLGTPVIASRGIPSLERIGATGVHLVDPLNVENLRRAFLTFLDEDYAECKRQEAIYLTLPTWRTFTEGVLGWCAPQDKSFRATV